MRQWPRFALLSSSALIRALSSSSLSSSLASVGDRFPTKEEEETWRAAMSDKYGEGRFKLMRALYSDLADEMRREAQTKPPPPLPNWSVHHTRGQRFAEFVQNCSNGATVVAQTEITLDDPAHKKENIVYADWAAIGVAIIRKHAVIVADVAELHGSMLLRNVRIHKPEHALEKDGTFSFARHAQHKRRFLYDGPWQHHLEVDVHAEMWDLLIDYNITYDFVRWVKRWAMYLEHAEYVNWNLELLEWMNVDQVEKEEHLLTAEEVQRFQTPAEKWLPAHNF